MQEYVVPIAAFALCSTPIFLHIHRFFFPSWREFIDAVFFFFVKPDSWSWIDEELREGWWAVFKLFLYVLTCIAIVAVEFFFLLPLIVRGSA